MTEPDFDEINRLFAAGDGDGFDSLAERFIASENFPAAFEARLMKKRLEMGLPLLAVSPDTLSEDQARAYAETQLEAARETGSLFLKCGDIRRAWPYFRAIGDPQSVREAIEVFEPSDDSDQVDGAIEVGFYEAVHPEKGLELLLRQHGICRAITTFSQYPDQASRERAGGQLIRSVYDEVRTNIRSALQSAGRESAEDASLLDLIKEHPDLFEGNANYIDTSHVISVLGFAISFEDPTLLQMAYQLTEYGRRLGEMYQFNGQPPFEQPFVDYGAYLRALLGIDADEALEHFRKKLGPEPDPFGDINAQTFVNLLLSLDRLEEAIDIAEERLADVPPERLVCPGPLEICERAGDLDRLKSIAEKVGNRLAYAAAVAARTTVEPS